MNELTCMSEAPDQGTAVTPEEDDDQEDANDEAAILAEQLFHHRLRIALIIFWTLNFILWLRSPLKDKRDSSAGTWPGCC